MPQSIAEHDDPETITITFFSQYASPQQQQLVANLRQSLLSFNIAFDEQMIFSDRQSNWQQLLSESNSDFIISFGQTSYEMVRSVKQQSPQKHLALMVRIETIEQLKQQPKANLYAITHQQPTDRYFALIRALNIFQPKVAVLFSQKNNHQKLDYQKASEDYTIPMVDINLEPRFQGKAAIEKLIDCCNILMLDRESILPSPKALRALLLQSYRKKILTVGYSLNLFNEGASFVIHTLPYQISQQAATLLANIQKGATIEAYQTPNQFSLEVNRNISQQLLSKDISLGEILNRMEQQGL